MTVGINVFCGVIRPLEMPFATDWMSGCIEVKSENRRQEGQKRKKRQKEVKKKALIDSSFRLLSV